MRAGGHVLYVQRAAISGVRAKMCCWLVELLEVIEDDETKI